MLETIFNSIGGNVVNAIAEKSGVTVDQAKEILPLAQETVQAGFMEQVTSGNVAGITSLFNSNETDMENNSIFSGIKNALVSSIVSKMGLPESVAGIAATSCIGNVVNEISGIAKDESGAVTETGFMQKFGVTATVIKDVSAPTVTEDVSVTEGVATVTEGVSKVVEDVSSTVKDGVGKVTENVTDAVKNKIGKITGGAF